MKWKYKRRCDGNRLQLGWRCEVDPCGVGSHCCQGKFRSESDEKTYPAYRTLLSYIAPRSNTPRLKPSVSYLGDIYFFFWEDQIFFSFNFFNWAPMMLIDNCHPLGQLPLAWSSGKSSTRMAVYSNPLFFAYTPLGLRTQDRCFLLIEPNLDCN